MPAVAEHGVGLRGVAVDDRPRRRRQNGASVAGDPLWQPGDAGRIAVQVVQVRMGGRRQHHPAGGSQLLRVRRVNSRRRELRLQKERPHGRVQWQLAGRLLVAVVTLTKLLLCCCC